MDRSDSAGGTSEGSVHGEASPPERLRETKQSKRDRGIPERGGGADDGKRKRRHGGVGTIRLLVSGRPTRYRRTATPATHTDPASKTAPPPFGFQPGFRFAWFSPPSARPTNQSLTRRRRGGWHACAPGVGWVYAPARLS
jgi:hypothetical protein